MAKDETLPFERGRTMFGSETIDAANLGGVNYEGKEYRIEDTIGNTGLYIKLRVVRNSAAFNLLPKKLVTFDPLYVGQRVAGHSFALSAPGCPVDELLPATGVRPNDLFYVIVEGPCKVLLAVSAGVALAPLDPIVALAGTSASHNDSGRITLSPSTTTRDSVFNTVGRAMATVAGAATGETLMYAKRWF